MHPVVLIPLASALGAAALAAAIAARAPGKRANRLMAAMLACDAWWALCQVLGLTASEPATALFYARLEMVGSAMLAPVALQLLAVVLPEPLLSDRRLLAARVRDRGRRRARVPRHAPGSCPEWCARAGASRR